MVSPVIYQFIAAQLKFSRMSKFGRRWSSKDKNLALQLYMSSSKAYYSLSRWFYLPSVSTLRKCVSGIESKPGFNRTILASVKRLASKLKPNKKCIISFDEMKLKPSLSYDKKHDTVVGYKDYGSFAVSDLQLMFLWCVSYVRNGNRYLVISSPANVPHQMCCTTFYLRG